MLIFQMNGAITMIDNPNKEPINIEKQSLPETFGGVILDTHILIWYVEGIILTKHQIDIIDEAKSNNKLFISPISIWEIAMLANKGKIVFSMDINDWINNVISIPGINVAELSIPVLVLSTSLPNYEHKDLADRIIMATSRSCGFHLMTFDQKIIDYANMGYLKTI